jgi:hypothetical protein
MADMEDLISGIRELQTSQQMVMAEVNVMRAGQEEMKAKMGAYVENMKANRGR